MAAPRQGVHEQGNEELTFGDAGREPGENLNRVGVTGASNRPEDEEHGFYEAAQDEGAGLDEGANDGSRQWTGSKEGGIVQGGSIHSSKES